MWETPYKSLQKPFESDDFLIWETKDICVTDIPEPPLDRAMYDRSARHYLNGRLDYSPTLFRHVKRVARLDRDSTVLDIGCGPGNIAHVLADHVGRVIGVDPSPEMVRLAKTDAPDNVSFVEGTLADVELPERSIRLAAFGRSFHWVDREETLEILDRLIEPDGCIALFGVNPIVRAGGPHDWYDAVIAALDALTGKPDEDVKPWGKNYVRHEFLLKTSAFNSVRDRGLVTWTTWDLDKLVSLGLSRYKASKVELDEEIVKRTIKRALLPYGKGPWRTLNQHRVLIASRPG